MFKQENLVPVVIVAGFIVALAILFGTRYQQADHARLERSTGEVDACIAANGHLMCR
jgi:fructose-specific phosphotransferase system IIC component